MYVHGLIEFESRKRLGIDLRGLYTTRCLETH